MARKRHTGEEIVAKLRQVDVLTAQGRPVAEAIGVTEVTYYRWRSEYGGLKSSQVKRLKESEAEIARLRRERLSGPAIARQARLPLSTVGAVLRRQGLGRLASVDPRPPVVRCERERPGELIHIDTKKLGRIDGVGHRITGHRTGMVRNRGIGWDHLHVAVDDASRLAYTEILPDDRKESATTFLSRGLAFLGRHGVTVERVMTDNGSAYRSRAFAATIRAAGLRHIRTRPYTPRTNGPRPAAAGRASGDGSSASRSMAERFIQSSLREWAYAKPFINSAERTQAMTPWIGRYNHSRPHSALGGQPPISRIAKDNLLGSDS